MSARTRPPVSVGAVRGWSGAEHGERRAAPELRPARLLRVPAHALERRARRLELALAAGQVARRPVDGGRRDVHEPARAGLARERRCRAAAAASARAARERSSRSRGVRSPACGPPPRGAAQASRPRDAQRGRPRRRAAPRANGQQRRARRASAARRRRGRRRASRRGRAQRASHARAPLARARAALRPGLLGCLRAAALLLALRLRGRRRLARRPGPPRARP